MEQNTPNNDEVLFSEEQKMRLKWVWLLVVIVAVGSWAAFIEQVVFGNQVGSRPAPNFVVWLILILFGIGLPWFFYTLKLVTRLHPSNLTIRFRPLITRTIPLKDIASCEPRDYRPIREFGGWGLRFSFKHGRAYNMYGNRGVQLILKDDRRVLVGSQKADELAENISRLISVSRT